MNSRDGADEVAVGDVGKCRQMGLETTLLGDVAPRSDESSDFLILGIWGIAYTQSVYEHPTENLKSDLRLTMPAFLDSNGPPPTLFKACTVPGNGPSGSDASGIVTACVMVFSPPLPTRLKLRVVVKIGRPRCRACTVRVMKLRPSRTRSTWYRIGISESPARTK